MRGILAAVALAAALSGCADPKQPLADVKTQADATIAKLQPTFEMACWSMQAADIAFNVFVAPQADPGIVAIEREAAAVANAICANPPQNTGEVIAAVLQAYKAATIAASITAGPTL